MSQSTTFPTTKQYYPIAVSIFMIVLAIGLSFVDLAFLNDVIGKILDIGPTESLFIAFALGIVGIAIMAHQGVKVAHSEERFVITALHYLLWIGLGIAFSVIRLLSATIMQLDGSSGDQMLLKIAGMNIREVDLVVAPLMFLLYLATGLIVKDGVKNYLLHPDRNKFWDKRKKNKRLEELERKRLAEEARKRRLEEEANSKKTAEERKAAHAELQRKIKLDKKYFNALTKYRKKLLDIQEQYIKISENNDLIRLLDKREDKFNEQVKPSLIRIISSSLQSTQHAIALMIHSKHVGSNNIDDLRDTIDKFNRGN